MDITKNKKPKIWTKIVFFISNSFVEEFAHLSILLSTLIKRGWMKSLYMKKNIPNPYITASIVDNLNFPKIETLIPIVIINIEK